MPGFIADIFGNQYDYSFFSILRKIENNYLYFCSPCVIQSYYIKPPDFFFYSWKSSMKRMGNYESFD